MSARDDHTLVARFENNAVYGKEMRAVLDEIDRLRANQVTPAGEDVIAVAADVLVELQNAWHVEDGFTTGGIERRVHVIRAAEAISALAGAGLLVTPAANPPAAAVTEEQTR